MFDERDTRAPAWAWLRGFAWFLLAWPLFSLLALDKLDLDDWESILLATLGPAAIGLVLLGIEAALTRLLGRRMSVTQAVPSTLRDVANLGITMAILLAIDVVLITVFDDDPLIKGGDPRAATLAATMLAIFCGTAVVFRGLARAVYGPARIADLGDGWDQAPAATRFLGYCTLIPMLLVCTVMIDYTLHDRPDFGRTAWIALPALLWLGIRSATARAPRWWAKDPWEAWIRRTSLSLPWWLLGLALALGFVAVCFLIPLGLIDDTTTTRVRILGGVVMVPLGLIVLAFAVMTLVRGVPALLRDWRLARRLTRGAAHAIAWSTTATPGQVRLTLADGREHLCELGDAAPSLIAWLNANTKPLR